MPEANYAEMKKTIIEGDADRARTLARSAVDADTDLLAAIDEGFAAGIRAVGDLWEEGEYFLPELVQGAEAMKAAMEVINPALEARRSAQKPKGRVVIGTVQGDLHDIGKSLVATLLSANGFQVYDLGNDVPVEAFLNKAREVGADILAASALLTTTMPVQRALVEAVAAGGLSSRLRVLVGGSATTQGWADEIGAAYAENALRAVAMAEALLS